MSPKHRLVGVQVELPSGQQPAPVGSSQRRRSPWHTDWGLVMEKMEHPRKSPQEVGAGRRMARVQHILQSCPGAIAPKQQSPRYLSPNYSCYFPGGVGLGLIEHKSVVLGDFTSLLFKIYQEHFSLCLFTLGPVFQKDAGGCSPLLTSARTRGTREAF